MDKTELKHKLIDVVNGIHSQKEYAKNNEEATKNAMIIPFIEALGYDTRMLNEVIPEFTADVGTKKGEKVDYAIMKEEQPIILIECKPYGHELNKDCHKSQLYRYFSCTEAQIGMLTNGLEYRIYSDLKKNNTMDHKSFMTFSLDEEDSIDHDLLDFLMKLTKDHFDIAHLTADAHHRKYKKELKEYLYQQIDNPDEDFVCFVCNKILDLKASKKNKAIVSSIIKPAMHELTGSKYKNKLKSIEDAMHKADAVDESMAQDQDKKVNTTEDELRGFHIVQAILCRWGIDPNRITHRDNQTYFPIILDDNSRKTICRLYVESTDHKYLAFLDENRKEIRHAIKNVEDLYKYTAKFKEVLTSLEPSFSNIKDQSLPFLELSG